MLWALNGRKEGRKERKKERKKAASSSFVVTVI
jgi:hypothetical protein